MSAPVRIAIDGRDAAGKTTLADSLAESLQARGVPAARLSADDYLNPPEVRRRRGEFSVAGYLLDAFDHDALLAAVRAWSAPRGVLIVDGVFLLRPGLREVFDLTVYLDISAAESLRRALQRDVPRLGSAAQVRERYVRRYLPAYAAYLDECRPEEVADVVVETSE